MIYQPLGRRQSELREPTSVASAKTEELGGQSVTTPADPPSSVDTKRPNVVRRGGNNRKSGYPDTLHIWSPDCSLGRHTRNSSAGLWTDPDTMCLVLHLAHTSRRHWSQYANSPLACRGQAPGCVRRLHTLQPSVARCPPSLPVAKRKAVAINGGICHPRGGLGQPLVHMQDVSHSCLMGRCHSDGATRGLFTRARSGAQSSGPCSLVGGGGRKLVVPLLLFF